MNSAENIAELRDAHAEKYDDGKTCGDPTEHYELFNAIPKATDPSDDFHIVLGEDGEDEHPGLSKDCGICNRGRRSK